MLHSFSNRLVLVILFCVGPSGCKDAAVGSNSATGIIAREKSGVAEDAESARARLSHPAMPPSLPVACEKTGMDRAMRVATSWLRSLATHQFEALAKHTALPLLASGFDTGNFPERKDCGTDTGVRMDLRIETTKSHDLGVAMKCLAMD